MNDIKIISIKENVFADNDRQAEILRNDLKKQKVFLLNLMSSPGAGKTTMLTALIEKMIKDYKIGIIEADIDSDVDAVTIEKTGAKVIQLHTGGMCHLNADMTRQGLNALGIEGLDLVVLENIGNLICTADFDTGASKNIMILSVPEGDDKPLKYPHMFTVCDVLLVSKMDTISVFDFDLDACTERVKKLNPKIKVIPICAKTGEGMDLFVDWLSNEIKNWKLDPI